MWQVILAFCCGGLAAGLAAWWWNRDRAERHVSHEKSLLKRTRRAEKLAELGTLASHLAHEIRNPLSIMKVNLQLLGEDIRNLAKTIKQSRESGIGIDSPIDSLETRFARQLRKVDTITGEADRLAETLNNFLRYAGKMELHLANCDINELLDDLIDFYEPQAMSKGITIRSNVDKARKAICRIDADLIKQALLNLFINAVQAMGDEGELIIQSQVGKDSVVIDIIDTGPGISVEEQQHIFDAYFTTKSGGTGLGLAICRRVIEEHDGHIELFSEKGKGSNFKIVLPLVME